MLNTRNRWYWSGIVVGAPHLVRRHIEREELAEPSCFDLQHPFGLIRVSGSQNESHFGRAIRAILRAVNRSFGSSLSLSPYPWRARGIASKVISYTCRSIGSG